MTTPHLWAGRTGEHVTVPTVNASVPQINDSCPECGLGIADGSSWRMDTDSMRLHTPCLDKRRRAAWDKQAAFDTVVEQHQGALDGLGDE